MLPQGKPALVTGAASGIGEGIAKAMAENGAQVIVADVNDAGPAVFLASDLARYVTGVTLPVDGGFRTY